MSWCPVCKSEYREDFKKCSDCQSVLIEKLEQIKQDIDYDHEVFLKNVRDGIEADVLESLLKANKIPVLRKFKDAGSYLNIYTGNSYMGIDIYVPSRLFESAKEIIDGAIEEDEYYFKEAYSLVDEEKFMKRKRKIKSWIIIIMIMPGLLLIIISIIKSILGDMFG